MQNQKTFELLLNEFQGESLEHHGVKWQSWGDRNGPPYPLNQINKKVARMEYKAKKEKEKRLKKMQKAAAKARKLKKKELKNQEAIQKKKQALVKEGNLDKIRKNANLFTNEELQYIIERDAQKRALGSKNERTTDEKMEIALKRLGQIAGLAASAGTIFSAAKQGADALNAFKATKVKDLEAEDKRMNAIKTEFEMRFKGRESSPEAQMFVDAATNNKEYIPPKESKADKAERKASETARIDAANEYFDLRKQSQKQSKLDKQEQKIADDMRQQQINLYWENKKAEKNAKKAISSPYSKMPIGDDHQWKVGIQAGKKLSEMVLNSAADRDVKKTISNPYTTDGQQWTNGFFSSGWSGALKDVQKGFQVTPQKKKQSKF